MNDNESSRLLTDRDREILAFAAAHRLVLTTQIQGLLGVDEPVARGRLSALNAAGLLNRDRAFHHDPGSYRMTRSGLAAINSDLPPLNIDLHSYRKDIGVGWVWLAATHGVYGEDIDRVMTKHELRAHDRALTVRTDDTIDPPTSLTPPLAVRLDGIGPGAPPRQHYPDLLLMNGPDRIAIELELSLTARRRLEQIMIGYRNEPDIAAVLYLADDPMVFETAQAAATDLGISDRVHVQRARFPDRR